VAVNRTELAESVASITGLDKKQSEAAVEAVTKSIVDQIKSGNRVSIFGFGSFEPRDRAARTARNPQTQAIVKVAAAKAVSFKPAAAFKATLNTKGRSTAKKAAPTAKASASKSPAARSAVAKAPARKATATAKAPARATAKAPARATAKATAKAPAKATKAVKAAKKR
jgi:DNA-binding protein HU-beta